MLVVVVVAGRYRPPLEGPPAPAQDQSEVVERLAEGHRGQIRARSAAREKVASSVFLSSFLEQQ